MTALGRLGAKKVPRRSLNPKQWHAEDCPKTWAIMIEQTYFGDELEIWWYFAAFGGAERF